jgi:hypothetical protein
VFDWLTRRAKGKKLPHYAALRKQPSRPLPSDLLEQEAGEAYRERHHAIERSLMELPNRPEPESPLFFEILLADQGGLLAMTLPEDNSHCLLVFTSLFRASDYVRTALESSSSVQFLSSSPLEFDEIVRSGSLTFEL